MSPGEKLLLLAAVLGGAGALVVGLMLWHRRERIKRGERVKPFVPETAWGEGRRPHSDDERIDAVLVSVMKFSRVSDLAGACTGFFLYMSWGVAAELVFNAENQWLAGFALGAGAGIIHAWGWARAVGSRKAARRDARELVRGLLIAALGGALGAVPMLTVAGGVAAGAVSPASINALEWTCLLGPALPFGFTALPIALYGSVLWNGGEVCFEAPSAEGESGDSPQGSRGPAAPPPPST